MYKYTYVLYIYRLSLSLKCMVIYIYNIHINRIICIYAYIHIQNNMYIYLYISCMYIYHTYIFFFTMYQPVLGCTSTVMMSAIPIPRFGFDLWSFVRLHRLLARHGRRANLRLHRRFFFWVGNQTFHGLQNAWKISFVSDPGISSHNFGKMAANCHGIEVHIRGVGG